RRRAHAVGSDRPLSRHRRRAHRRRPPARDPAVAGAVAPSPARSAHCRAASRDDASRCRAAATGPPAYNSPMNAVSAASDAAAAAPADRLRITEIFLSLQGEARDAGWPTVFVRLTGCPLRCQYCDTAYAFHGGQWRGIDDILAEVAGHGVRHVCVTGGEPLSQKRCIGLLRRLCDAGHLVSLETSGAIDIS